MLFTTPDGHSTKLTANEIETLSKSVVQIRCRDWLTEGGWSGGKLRPLKFIRYIDTQGTGVFISFKDKTPDGWREVLATNWHVTTPLSEQKSLSDCELWNDSIKAAKEKRGYSDPMITHIGRCTNIRYH